MRRNITFVLVLLIFLLGCIGQEEHIKEPEMTPGPELHLDVVISLSHLNFNLEQYTGEKIWVSGFYGDEHFTGDGVSFLVSDFDTLMVNEPLPPHSFARLDGDVPPSAVNGAEVLVYGEVKDFGAVYNAYTLLPTPLITVEDYIITQESSFTLTYKVSFATPTKMQPSGTKAKKCDKAIVVCGGSDDNNDRRRYKDDITAKVKKLRELGFSDDQISVLYKNGEEIKVDGKNAVDSQASKQKIVEMLETLIQEMQPSCTLTIFVTGHGTGYNPKKGFSGARPDEKGGILYEEKKTWVDLRVKVHNASGEYKNAKGESFFVSMNKKENQLKLYKKENGKWVLRGSDTNKDGSITETETGQDIDGDGDKDNMGFSTAHLGTWQHEKNEWDTDGVAGPDVKAEWDGSKYNIYRKKDNEWKKMGEDKNGDFKIDEKDGGIDWNCDGDTDDTVGFHEGISLRNNEVLWDDELAAMLKALHEKGAHTRVEMNQCYSGGFIENLKGIVEDIVTCTSEDRYSYSYHDSNGKDHDYFEKAFAENLNGIDKDSWDKAFEKAKKADNDAYEEWKKRNPGKSSDYYEGYKNNHSKWEKPVYQSGSMVSEENGDYILVIEIPEELTGKVYDIEILFGLQKPRWEQGAVVEVPAGYAQEKIPGGIRINSDQPFPRKPVVFRVKGAENAESIRVELTDKNHKSLGYLMPQRVPHWILECTITLSKTSALEYWEASPKEKEELREKAEAQYIEDMKAELLIYIRSTHPSVTEEMRECAKSLLDYLNSDTVSQEEKEQIARLYWENFKAILGS